MKESTCINIDSIQWLEAYQGDKFASLVFADPPFNIGWEYDNINDSMPDHEFIQWLKKWISLCIDKILTPTGQLVICMGDEYVSDLDVMCRRELGLHRQNWIIWHYGFGQSGKLDQRKRFTKSKTHMLRYSINKKKFIFNPAAIAVPSGRQTTYGDKRADPRGKCPDDVFIFDRVAGSHNTRVKGISTQMPLKMITRIIKALTNPGDTIYDPFPGSGVSIISSIMNGRNCIGTEISPTYCELINSRISGLTTHNNS